jgi:hypothetical protein
MSLLITLAREVEHCCSDTILFVQKYVGCFVDFNGVVNFFAVLVIECRHLQFIIPCDEAALSFNLK